MIRRRMRKRQADQACAAAGCGRPAKGKGLCSGHYMRQWRYGDLTAGAPPRAPGEWRVAKVCEVCGASWAPVTPEQARLTRTCGQACRARLIQQRKRDGVPPMSARLAERVVIEGECHIWTGPLSDGYGRLSWNGRPVSAHRAAYELARGLVPEGLELDHLCRRRACINPDHLEPVTHIENVRRGAKARPELRRSM